MLLYTTVIQKKKHEKKLNKKRNDCNGMLSEEKIRKQIPLKKLLDCCLNVIQN